MQILTWAQKLGKPECPYLVRWVLDLGVFSIRLHHWYFGDDPRAHHDHPWWFIVLVLKGNYTDVSPAGNVEMHRWKVAYRPATHRHTVVTKGCWTLLLCGPEEREWGFYVMNKSKTREVWFKAKRYFIKNGHHPCQKN